MDVYIILKPVRQTRHAFNRVVTEIVRSTNISVNLRVYAIVVPNQVVVSEYLGSNYTKYIYTWTIAICLLFIIVLFKSHIMPRPQMYNLPPSESALLPEITLFIMYTVSSLQRKPRCLRLYRLYYFQYGSGIQLPTLLNILTQKDLRRYSC